MISAYDGGVYRERKNGLLFQAVEYRIVKCGIAAAGCCGLDSVLASSKEFLRNICQGIYPQTFYKCVLTFKESFFETIGSDLQSVEPWTETESNDTLAFLFVEIQL